MLFRSSISAEHGVGMTKRDYLTYSRSPVEIEYNQRAKSLFATIAPRYLQRVKELYASDKNTLFALRDYSQNGFKFVSSSGLLFEYDYNGLNLTFNRIPWYGSGQLLGKTYWLDVAYFDPALVTALQAVPGKTNSVRP